ncbi:MerR family transcriptional regulator [Halomonas urumqiensis]|uniref:Helix-turn-helix-type transcriptional regulator n=1 Tax=Halomonas urumqiensis TaxID=1684789 RepID=A0A2N7UI44_9GAMM|nr:MerR family transcriptional regulator [Halomonas urumqiensis]PMR80104.1 helix-turn-helix-type transcriptional regulator [Halomonas urumqiensis]PTB01261.1 MerR family DNA-binding transcriptional regulator [Halomonas urumqiensis]GHE22631.1 MerR family transcriptional regulator [Halomonas urumqiensis]
MSEQAPHTGDTPLYPIREVSRITGVNSVTLRAWERRYGLIKPQRTPKGHRLYAREDIARVEQILQWLNRGVPVSQVRELLDRPTPMEPQPPDTSDWSSQRTQLMTAVAALDQHRLDMLFSQSLSLYPVSVCIAELWQPVIQALEEGWGERLGDTLQRRFLEAFLRTRIGTRLLHANRVVQGPALLISAMPEDPGSLWVLLVALAASDKGFEVQLFDAPLPFSELPLAVEHLHAGALLLASGQAEKSDLVRRQLPRLAEQLDVPLALCGPVARIRASELTGSQVEVLGDDLGQAMVRLKALLPQGSATSR